MSEQVEVDQESMREVISVSLQFIRTMTEVYGIDRGEAVWKAVSEATGSDVRDAVMLAMLTGNGGSGVELVRILDTTRPVEFIKAIRNATGLGLKEAKDVYDKVKNGSPTMIECQAKFRASFARDLRSLGAITA